MKLVVNNIIKIYKGRKVVKGVSLEVNQGEIVGLLGPNGAGKTTSFYMIVGLIKPNGGTIFLDNTDITNYPMYKRAQSGIGYLAQEASVFRKLSIEDNIKSVLQLTKLSKAEQQRKTDELIDEFSLGHIRKNRGDLLSGGERRRTEIARALATSPKFILLDEPFAGVDPIAVEDIQRIVAQLKNKNIGILITDHNVQETLAITDRTYLMFEGGILKSGVPEDLAADEMVRKVYLGRNFELRRKKILEDDDRNMNQELENNKVQPDNGGAGHGGQNGNSAVPTKSDVSPSSQQARAGETGTIKQSSVGSNTGSGLVGPEGPGIGYASTGSGEGLSNREGTGGTEVDVGGGGTFSYDGYWSNLQSAINSNYPTDAYAMGIQGDVTLRIYFAPGGSVASVEVLNSDDPILSEHAMEYAHSVGGAENSTGTQQYADITIHYNL